MTEGECRYSLLSQNRHGFQVDKIIYVKICWSELNFRHSYHLLIQAFMYMYAVDKFIIIIRSRFMGIRIETQYNF